MDFRRTKIRRRIRLSAIRFQRRLKYGSYFHCVVVGDWFDDARPRWRSRMGDFVPGLIQHRLHQLVLHCRPVRQQTGKNLLHFTSLCCRYICYHDARSSLWLSNMFRVIDSRWNHSYSRSVDVSSALGFFWTRMHLWHLTPSCVTLPVLSVKREVRRKEKSVRTEAMWKLMMMTMTMMRLS